MMMMNYTDGLVATYSFFILLSTFLVLVPYLFTVAAYGILLIQKRTSKHHLSLIISSISMTSTAKVVSLSHTTSPPSRVPGSFNFT